MKSVVSLSLLVVIISLASCIKPKEPNARICPEEPLVMTTLDTLVLENCSEHYESQLWELPGGATSTQNKVAFTSATEGAFTIILKVRNNDYANEYRVERPIQVVKP